MGQFRIVAVIVLLGSTLVAVLVIRGCTNQHDRPVGHTDMTFAIGPGGDRIAFNAAGRGGRDLYVIDLTDFRVSRIAETPEYEVDPCFSPDGKSILHAAGQPGDRADHLFIRPIQGGPARQLTFADANDSSPRFSPDGSLIVFLRAKSYFWGGLGSNWGDYVLYLVNEDGSGLRQLTADGMLARQPYFSPDGKSVRFVGADGLYTVPIDGSRPPKKFVDIATGEASYSPDGETVVLTMGQFEPDVEVYVTPIDSVHPRRLTHVGGCYGPTFTPDGGRVLFLVASWPDGPTGVPRHNLWEVDRDGSGQHELMDYGLFDNPLHWRPRPAAPERSTPPGS